MASPTGYVIFGDHTRIVKYARFPFARGADGTQILKSNTARIPDELLYQIIRSVDLSNYGYARHFKFLKDTPTAIPTDPVARKFAEITTPIYDKHSNLILENIELTNFRDWLLPMLMNGQATVADVEEEVSKVLPFAPQTVEVRQAARNFGDKETDDTADLVKAFMRRKQHDSKA